MGERTETQWDFEERAFQFAWEVRALVKRIPRTICNRQDVKQLARCSGSVGANYIETTDPLGPKDFKYRLRIARKEARESRHFLRLLNVGGDAAVATKRDDLIQEATELTRILSAMIRNAERREANN